MSSIIPSYIPSEIKVTPWVKFPGMAEAEPMATYARYAQRDDNRVILRPPYGSEASVLVVPYKCSWGKGFFGVPSVLIEKLAHEKRKNQFVLHFMMFDLREDDELSFDFDRTFVLNPYAQSR